MTACFVRRYLEPMPAVAMRAAARVRAAAGLTLALAGVVVPCARAQCPDGTPPPCARRSSVSAEARYARAIMSERAALQQAGDFRGARALTCRALAILPEQKEGWERPLDCSTLHVSTELPRGASPDALSRMRDPGDGEAPDEVANEVRNALASTGLLVGAFSEVPSHWGVTSPVYFVSLRDPDPKCRSGEDYRPWFPCDSAAALFEVTISVRPQELLVAVASANYMLSFQIQQSLMDHFGFPAHPREGYTEYSRRSRYERSVLDVDEDRTVLRDSLLCGRTVTTSWRQAPLATALADFQLSGSLSFAVDRSARGVVVDGMFRETPWCNAMWNLLATYRLRVERISPSTVLVTRSARR
jgi:hypothetical protein